MLAEFLLLEYQQWTIETDPRKTPRGKCCFFCHCVFHDLAAHAVPPTLLQLQKYLRSVRNICKHKFVLYLPLLILVLVVARLSESEQTHWI